jgi:ArsR family transcriptional regulator, arsenate/arsenite/antimonite-responsive transcriptional repressor
MEIEKIALCLKALGDPKRIQLLTLIQSGTQCNCEFASSLDLQPNLISHHLRILKEAGLVNIERDPLDSRWIYYTINLTIYKELRDYLAGFLDPTCVQSRRSTCGPINEVVLSAVNILPIIK